MLSKLYLYPPGILYWCCGKHTINPSDSKVHGANIGPTWVLSAPDGPHVGPMNPAIRASASVATSTIRISLVLWCEPNKIKHNKTVSISYVQYLHRADSRFAPSQWETALLCNDVSHWLDAYLKSAVFAYTSARLLLLLLSQTHCLNALDTPLYCSVTVKRFFFNLFPSYMKAWYNNST